jgi:excisionase family DNA binding protein
MTQPSIDPETIFNDRRLSLPEVAQLLGTRVSTVRKWVRDGELQALRLGKGYQVWASAVRDFKQAREREVQKANNEKRLERERQAELSRMQSSEPDLKWAISSCIVCGRNRFLTTRHQRLDGDAYCDLCIDRGKEEALSKDGWERKAALRAEELNNISKEQGYAYPLPEYFTHHCGWCKAPYVLSRSNLKNHSYIPECDHLIGPFRRQATVGSVTYREAIKHVILDLSRLEIRQRKIEREYSGKPSQLCYLCRCSCCSEVMAVAQRDDYVIGRTRCRPCTVEPKEPDTEIRARVIVEALAEVCRGIYGYIAVTHCSRCKRPEIKEMAKKAEIILSWCEDKMDRHTREQIATRFGKRCSLSQTAMDRLCWDIESLVNDFDSDPLPF